MAADIFAKLGDIKGESADAKHKDEIEILSWSWGMSQVASMASGGVGGTGKASFNDFQITHYIDKASPNLMKACATLKKIDEATITQRKAGGKGEQLEFLIIKMKGVIITGVAPAGHGGDGGLVQESIMLQCASVDLEYKPLKPDGSLDAGVHFKYDIKAMKEG
jgi:type VI secretion system secreted protein Hcp